MGIGVYPASTSAPAAHMSTFCGGPRRLSCDYSGEAPERKRWCCESGLHKTMRAASSREERGLP